MHVDAEADGDVLAVVDDPGSAPELIGVAWPTHPAPSTMRRDPVDPLRPVGRAAVVTGGFWQPPARIPALPVAAGAQRPRRRFPGSGEPGSVCSSSRCR